MPTSGNDAGSYTLNYASGLSSSAGYNFNAGTGLAYNITPAPLGITASNQNKTYGDTLAFAGTEFTAIGLKNGQTVGGVTLASSGAGAAANVIGSPYAITASTATGGSFNPSNYSVSYTSGALNVTARPLTVSFTPQSKTYDGSTTATVGGFTLSNLANGDSLGLNGSAVYDSRHVGTGKIVSYSALVLANGSGVASNYSLPATAVAGGSITPLSNIAWTGGGGNSNWSNPANWGGVIVDGSNVLNANLAGNNVIYDAASGATNLNALSNVGGLTISGGTLGVAAAISSPVYVQSGGVLNGSGSLSITNSFSKSGGTIALAGPVSIAQNTGNLIFTNDAPLNLGAISTASGTIDIDNTGGIFTGASAIAANGGSLLLTARSPISIGSGGLNATGGITLSAPTAGPGSTITLNGAIAAGGAVSIAAYAAINQNAGIQGQTIALGSSSGNIAVASGAVSSVPPGGSISYSAIGGSITSSPGNFAGAVPTLNVAGSTAGTTTTSTTTTNDITSSISRTTESLAEEKAKTPEAAPAPAESSGRTIQLASISQTTGGETGTFGATEPVAASGSTTSNQVTDTTPSTGNQVLEQSSAKTEDKKEAGKEKDEKKDEKKESRSREEKKSEGRAAAKKAAQCS